MKNLTSTFRNLSYQIRIGRLYNLSRLQTPQKSSILSPFKRKVIPFVFLLLYHCVLSGQTQVGLDIDGEAAYDWFGRSTCLSSDGNRVAIGAFQNDGNGDSAGHVQVYDWDGTSWIQVGLDIDGNAADDHFGSSVSLSSNGSRVAIGAPMNDGSGVNTGYVGVYDWAGTSWVQVGSDIDGEAAGDLFGGSVSLSSDGSRVAIGGKLNAGNGEDAGHVRVYDWDGTSWIQVGFDIDAEAAGDWFGESVSLSSDGSRVAIGAPMNDGNGDRAGHVQLFDWDGTSWIQIGSDIDGEVAGDRFGWDVSLSSDGSRVAIGARFNNGNGNNAGHARIYDWAGTSWVQVGSDIDGEAAGDFFGESVSLSSDGSRVAIGGKLNDGNGDSAGHTRIYDWDGASWVQLGSDIDGEVVGDRFGWDVSLSSNGSQVAIGATGNDGTGTDAGNVRIYSTAPISTDAFITTWTGTNITIPIRTSAHPYDYTINWGDGSPATSHSTSAGTAIASHTYSSAGPHTIKITGTFPAIYFSNGPEILNIQSVEQWGNIQWESFERAFMGCSNLNINAIDAPDLTAVTNMISAFQGCASLNEDIGNWDVSNVENMNSMFLSATAFNQDVGNWDVSEVTNMHKMFANAPAFNQNIGSWGTKVSKVENMSAMFLNATAFNQDIGGWDVSSVFNMNKMFHNASSFNQNIGSWNVAMVTDMHKMFANATAFNQDIGGWSTTSLIEMTFMFNGAFAFNQDISGWDVSNVKDMESVFNFALAFDQVLSSWNVAGVTNMKSMFQNARVFNQDLNSWDVSDVTNMEGMFFKAWAYNQDLSSWATDVSGVTTMKNMFNDAFAFNQDLGNWNIENVSDMDGMLSNSGMDLENYDNTLIGWGTQNVQSNITLGSNGLKYCLGQSARNDELIINNGWIINGDIWDCSGVFDNGFHTIWETTAANESITIPTVNSLTYDYSVDWGDGTVTRGEDGDATHTYALAGTYTVKIIGDFRQIYFNNTGDKDKITEVVSWGNLDWNSFVNAFYGTSNLSTVPNSEPQTYRLDLSFENAFKDAVSLTGNFGNWDVTKIYNMRGMFWGASSFNDDISGWDVSNTTNMHHLFSGATLFNQDIGSWDMGNVLTTEKMFQDCINFNQDLDDWNVSEVTNMWAMFSGATSFDMDISSWDVSKVENFGAMFYEATSFNQDINSWNTSSASYMQTMFQSAYSFDQDLNNWDVSNVVNMSYMFWTASSFDGNISSWDMSSVTTINSMFGNASSFNGDLSAWDVSSVTDMARVFYNIILFNSDLSNWDVANVTDMSLMFYSTKSFNQDIGNWDVSSVTNIAQMFRYASAFNQDISNWDVSNVNYMASTFYLATSFDQDLGNWDMTSVSNVTDMLFLSGLSKTNYDKTLIGWAAQLVHPNLSLGSNGLTYCSGKAARANLINIDGWSISGDTEDCGAPFILKFDVNSGQELTIPTDGNGYLYDVNWGDGQTTIGHTSDATHIYATSGEYTVEIIGDFPHIYFNNAGDKDDLVSIEQWGNIEWESMENAFYGCSNLVINATDAPDLSMVTNMRLMFMSTNINSDISHWDVSTITDMSYLFAFNSSFNQDLGNWNTTNTMNMSFMFGYCSSFDQSLADLEIDNVMNMVFMLNNCDMSPSNYDATLTSWAGQSYQPNVNLGAIGRVYCTSESDRTTLLNSGWSISGDSKGCPITVPFITKWKTTGSNQSISIPAVGGNSNYTVNWGDGVTESNLEGTSNHTYTSGGTYTVEITGIFPGIRINNSVTNRDKIQSIEQWGNNEWKSLKNAFYGASNLVNNASDIPNLSQLSNLSNMFRNAGSFNVDLSSWNITNISDMRGMLSSSGLDLTNYDNTLIGWSGQSVQTGVRLGAIDLSYCNGEAARANLISNKGWIIDGDGQVCPITVAFETTWETTTTGEIVKIGTKGSGYDYTVDWGDGSVTSGHTAAAEHVYAAAGIQTVKITGVFPQIYMFGGTRTKLMGINQWGDNKWRSMERAFYGCANLENNASDAPNLSDVTDFAFMFHKAELFDADMGSWDISQGTKMTYMLYNTGLSLNNYDNTLIGWAAQSVQPNVKLSARGLKYCAGENARNNLINTHGWSISRDAKDCLTPIQSNPDEEEMSIKSEAFYTTEAPTYTTFESVKVYPNPTNGELTINYDLSTNQDVEILVRDLTGKMLYRMNQSGILGENQATLNLSTNRNGVYLLQLTNGEQNLTRKIVKQ